VKIVILCYNQLINVQIEDVMENINTLQKNVHGVSFENKLMKSIRTPAFYNEEMERHI
jgi:hypothetical protein